MKRIGIFSHNYFSSFLFNGQDLVGRLGGATRELISFQPHGQFILGLTPCSGFVQKVNRLFLRGLIHRFVERMWTKSPTIRLILKIIHIIHRFWGGLCPQASQNVPKPPPPYIYSKGHLRPLSKKTMQRIPKTYG